MRARIPLRISRPSVRRSKPAASFVLATNMSATDEKRSLDKAESGSEAGSLRLKDKVGDAEKGSVHDTASSEEGNVGLHEFAIAKQSGLRVTPEQNRRFVSG